MLRSPASGLVLILGVVGLMACEPTTGTAVPRETAAAADEDASVAPASAGASTDTMAAAEPRASASDSDSDRAAELAELEERHSADVSDLEVTRALVALRFDRGEWDQAWRDLEVTLYYLAQRDALPPVKIWLDELEARFSKPERLEEGTRFLSVLRRYYFRSPEVHAELIARVVASGDLETASQLVTDARARFPDDDRFVALQHSIAAE